MITICLYDVHWAGSRFCQGFEAFHVVRQIDRQMGEPSGTQVWVTVAFEQLVQAGP